MRTSLKYLFLLTILALIIWATFFRINSSKGQAAGGAQSNRPSTVKVYIAKNALLDNKLEAIGTVLSNEEVELRSEVTGRVIKIYFQEGTPVRKDELLIKINDAELQAQLQRAESKKKLAESNEARQRSLMEKSVISQNEYDIALNELSVSKADIELIKAQLAKTEIRAPFDGVIGLKYISEGSYITSTNRIASLQNRNAIKIDFTIPEKYSSAVKTRDAVEFTVEGQSTVFKGYVYAIEPKVDPVTRALQLRAMAPVDSRVLPGAFANIIVYMSQQPNALMIPTQALIPELKGQRVFLYQSGKAISQKVKTGVRTSDQVQITDGIKAGDTVIVSGIMQLRPGASVDIESVISKEALP